MPEGDALLVAELALEHEMRKPSIAPRATPDYLYVRIGERPAPRALLRRVPVVAPFRLRPDPVRRPDDGHCVQVDVRGGTEAGTLRADVVYGHDHPRWITLDHHGSFFIFHKAGTEWQLVRSGGWVD
ncbi:MAG TPA: hypothetical protein VJU18_09915 [Vicinamibacteria bacterium]|nr:hypothetical protein [Vicinamibacteria bacterium]